MAIQMSIGVGSMREICASAGSPSDADKREGRMETYLSPSHLAGCSFGCLVGSMAVQGVV